MAETPSTETDARSDANPESGWWYWVAAVPVYYVIGTVLGFVVGLAAFAFALTGMGTMDPGTMEPGMGLPMGVGFGFAGVFVLVFVLAAVGLLLSLVFPLAIYYDATAVEDAPGRWNPDPVLYGLLGLAGLVAQPLQVPLAVYYLYKRHESVGVP
ncbi:hypothetical protein LPA44_03620 [Halobacterium sp. KA-4]|jgi:hypothetical protein|uniref:hypothetical protein n=1 Tax=Halobacterium sp. KA-4 TaxID=2896367 RepID=UPI001E5FD34B|nr:hypothetical protein [Halobacterium sp. KA-4]MCD2198987.1 hypothetical protein [Halobacterium sp. KA-4]